MKNKKILIVLLIAIIVIAMTVLIFVNKKAKAEEQQEKMNEFRVERDENVDANAIMENIRNNINNISKQ